MQLSGGAPCCDGEAGGAKAALLTGAAPVTGNGAGAGTGAAATPFTGGNGEAAFGAAV